MRHWYAALPHQHGWQITSVGSLDVLHVLEKFEVFGKIGRRCPFHSSVPTTDELPLVTAGIVFLR